MPQPSSDPALRQALLSQPLDQVVEGRLVDEMAEKERSDMRWGAHCGSKRRVIEVGLVALLERGVQLRYRQPSCGHLAQKRQTDRTVVQHDQAEPHIHHAV